MEACEASGRRADGEAAAAAAAACDARCEAETSAGDGPAAAGYAAGRGCPDGEERGWTAFTGADAGPEWSRGLAE